MKRLMFVLFLALCLGFAVPSFAAPGVVDPTPVNLDEQGAFYDYRDYGTFSHGFAGGAEGRSGAYFQVYVAVVRGGLLTDFNQVKKVKAEHVETGLEYTLTPDVCQTWLGEEKWFHGIFMKPSEWMFSGTWKYILEYEVSGVAHRQVLEKPMDGAMNFPIKPSHVLVERDNGFFTLTWSGIGPPNWPGPAYRVRVFNEQGCAIDQFSGSYDAATGKASIQIPDTYEMNRIRIENRIQGPGSWSRAVLYMRLF